MRGSVSQALITGGRAEAEGSLFEVCGEKHQRESRGRPAGEGRHRRGHALPRPTWTSQAPPFPAPAASSPPPSFSGLARGLATWSPAWSSGCHESLLPSQHRQGQGRLLASGAAWLGQGQASLLVPAATPFPVSPEICPGISQPPLLGS